MKDPVNVELRIRVPAAMMLAIAALSFASIFITKLESAQVPPLVIAFYRMAIATALLLPPALAFRRKEIGALARNDFGLLALGGLCLAIHFGAWITSLKYIPIATSVVLVNSHPLFVVIASYLFLGERPARRSIIGTAVGFAGMIVISKDAFTGLQLALKGDGLALIGALAVVGYFVVGRKARADQLARLCHSALRRMFGNTFDVRSRVWRRARSVQRECVGVPGGACDSAYDNWPLSIQLVDQARQADGNFNYVPGRAGRGRSSCIGFLRAASAARNFHWRRAGARGRLPDDYKVARPPIYEC